MGENENLFLQHIDGDINNNHINNLKYVKYEDYLEMSYGNKWKSIKEYSEYYISDEGNVWSKFTNKILVNNLNKNDDFISRINELKTEIQDLNVKLNEFKNEINFKKGKSSTTSNNQMNEAFNEIGEI